jgi:hypothetical protein
MLTVLSSKRFVFGYSHGHVYPPQANTTTALKELYWTLYKLETTYPLPAFIVAGNFNIAKLRKSLPKFYHHIDYTTRAAKALLLQLPAWGCRCSRRRLSRKECESYSVHLVIACFSNSAEQ